MRQPGKWETHDLYCIVCGNKGIPIQRRMNKNRELLHRKALYCRYCRMTVNHIEIRTAEEAERFKKDFAAGKYQQEAAETVEYAKRKETEHEKL